MSDSTIPGERRQERSEETKEAIRLQLKHVKEQYGFEFLAVGDSYGYYITGSSDPELEEMLATFAPKIFEADDITREELEETLRQEIEPASEAAYIEVRKFPVRGMEMFICVVSPRRDGVAEALDHSINGIKRISGEESEA
jgi:hypothetical protein